MMPRWPFLVALCAAIAVGALSYRDHVFNAGVAAESTRRDAIDARSSLAATQARDTLNARIRLLQGMLDDARARVVALKKDLDDETAISDRRRADLLAGAAHDRVLIRAACTAGKTGPDGQSQGAGAGAVDSGTAIEADLDPRVASWLEGIRAERNAAIARLGACIQSYDAVKAAADAMP